LSSRASGEAAPRPLTGRWAQPFFFVDDWFTPRPPTGRWDLPMVVRAAWAVMKTVLLCAELVVLGYVAWLTLRQVIDRLGWTATDASLVAAGVCVGVVGVGLVRWVRRSGGGQPSAASVLVVGVLVAVLVWGSVAVALAGGALGGVGDLVAAPPDRLLPWKAGLVLGVVLMAQWLPWVADFSRHVEHGASRGSVTGWVVLGGTVPTVVLMVAGVVVASCRRTPERLFGYLDGIGWGWSLMLPLAVATLASVYLRAAASWAVVRSDWSPVRGAHAVGE